MAFAMKGEGGLRAINVFWKIILLHIFWTLYYTHIEVEVTMNMAEYTSSWQSAAGANPVTRASDGCAEM